MKRIFGLSALLVLITGLVVGTGAAAAEPWKFGVMADTQWTAPTDPAGKNPNGVPVSIIEQLNEQFIKHGVKFVIQVGDLTENGTRGPGHVFVFSHQNLMGENHQDSPFTGYADANPAWQNAFFANLQLKEAGYYISGHDHIHQRSIIASPNGVFKVQELICASNSSKFYTPKTLDDAKWYGQKRAQTSLSQERYTVGYYIFTVDGPRVIVEYYSDGHGHWQSEASFPNGPGLADTGITPTFHFVRKETWGYSLNGQEFLIPQGRTYSSVVDSFGITTARILGGANNSKARDGSLDTKGGVGRPLTKAVNTGWTDAQSWREGRRLGRVKKSDFDPASHILTLWGMADLGSVQTDAYALSMTYDRNKMGRGGFGLAAKNERGGWVNAVDLNSGDSFKKFVAGPWKAEYVLGTHGVDPKTKTAWAVINHNGEFAVGKFDQ